MAKRAEVSAIGVDKTKGSLSDEQSRESVTSLWSQVVTPACRFIITMVAVSQCASGFMVYTNLSVNQLQWQTYKCCDYKLNFNFKFVLPVTPEATPNNDPPTACKSEM